MPLPDDAPLDDAPLDDAGPEPVAVPVAVSVVLPVQDVLAALLAAVPGLVARWPVEVEAELVLAAGALAASEREALADLGGAVQVVALDTDDAGVPRILSGQRADEPYISTAERGVYGDLGARMVADLGAAYAVSHDGLATLDTWYVA